MNIFRILAEKKFKNVVMIALITLFCLGSVLFAMQFLFSNRFTDALVNPAVPLPDSMKHP